MNRYQSSAITAQQTLYEIQSLLNRVDELDNQAQKTQTLQIAFARTNDFVKKKQAWSVNLERLMYVFFDLAFNINKQFSIKDALKNYRSITQSQHSQSLKNVLEEYRDKKLENILEEQITQDDIKIIVDLPDIQNDEASSEIILSSFQPEQRETRQNLKNKLKIVWEGYKSIVDTVKVNQKLQGVYLTTLQKVFDFVDKFNRKHEFQSFCKNLRNGLQSAFSKRDKSQHQKGIYIDLENVDVNNRNIDIRMKQFKITTKLGLWRQSFQILEDINNLMQIRRGNVKNSVRCLYYENLAMLFKKSNYWHYHAFAFYCYYERYITNPKLTQKQKQDAADKLLLSIMCIPPSTLQSRQNKSSQEKISGMLVSSNKIPSKDQLCEIMISKGITQNTSENIRQLWNFMFLEFDLSSLSRGLQLLEKIEENQFKELLQNNLIYKQLISVAEVYRKIKLESLLTLIPLSRDKILSVLLKSHEQRIIAFSLDQKQGIVVFEQRDESNNPYDQFFETFQDVALTNQKLKQQKNQFINRKAESYIKDANQFFWNIRLYKINEYKKKMKKPQQQLLKKKIAMGKQEKQRRQTEQNNRRIRQAEAKRKAQQKQQELVAKKIKVEQIIKIKQQRVVRMNDKKVQHLTDLDLQQIPLETLNQYLEQTKKRVAIDNENKVKKIFTKIDYFERERRSLIKQQFEKNIINQKAQKIDYQFVKLVAEQDFKERQQIKDKLQKVANQLKPKITAKLNQMKNKFDQDYLAYKKRLTQEFKEKILNLARQNYQINQRRKQEQKIKQREQTTKQTQSNEKWLFKQTVRNDAVDLRPGNKQLKREIGFGLGDLKIGGAKKEEPEMKQSPIKNKNDKQFNGDIKIGGLSKQSNRFQAFKQDKKIQQKPKDEGSWIKGKNQADKKEDGSSLKKGGGFQPAPPSEKGELKKGGNQNTKDIPAKQPPNKEEKWL